VPFFSSADKAITAIVIVGIFLLVAFPFHEFAHALAAYRLGDGTARLFGRLTLDPRAHFDPMGGLLLAVTMISSGGTYGFGWAKPTPVAPHNLRGGRQGEAIVAFAGPASNLVLAAAAALPYRYIEASGMEVPALVDSILVTFIVINVLLLVFNLIPIPPLDGSKVLFAFLSPATSWRVRPVLEQYGFLILLAAIFLPIPPTGSTAIGIVFDVIGIPLLHLLIG
jgi:Zn-dependent protease